MSLNNHYKKELLFQMSGRGLTNLIRTFYHEDKNRYKKLLSCLPDLSNQQAEKIIQEKLKIIGETSQNTIQFVRDDGSDGRLLYFNHHNTDLLSIKPEPIESSIYGWASPDGKFYPCSYGEHLSLADALLLQSYGEESCVPDETLLNRKWMKLDDFSEIYRYNIHNNQKLINLLFDHLKHYKPEKLNDFDEYMNRFMKH